MIFSRVDLGLPPVSVPSCQPFVLDCCRVGGESVYSSTCRDDFLVPLLLTEDTSGFLPDVGESRRAPLLVRRGVGDFGGGFDLVGGGGFLNV